MENTKLENTTVGQMENTYQHALRLYQQAQDVASEEKEALLRQAYNNLLEVVERLALQASASAAVEEALVRLVSGIKAGMPPQLARKADEVLSLDATMKQGFQDVRQFARVYNRRVAQRLSKRLGFTPGKTGEAVLMGIEQSFVRPAHGCN